MEVWDKSLEQVHIVNVKSCVDHPLKLRHELCFLNFPRFDFIMLFQHLDTIAFSLHLVDEIRMVLDEIVEQWRHEDIVVGAGVAVAVYAEVKIDGDHRVVDHPAE